MRMILFLEQKDYRRSIAEVAMGPLTIDAEQNYGVRLTGTEVSE